MSWTFSPDPALDALISGIFADHPPLRPAGLGAMRDLMTALGDPQNNLPFVFHVAGTNGKGSTLAFLQAILESAGVAVHKYTSPHLVRFEERFVIAGRQVAPAALTAATERVLGAIAREDLKGKISFFEIFTAAAFILFAQDPAGAVLLETGLGGRLDATNIVARDIAILTRISFDHTRLLGDSLPEIAAEKAGIIKRAHPVILAPQPDADVFRVFEERALAQGATTFKAPRDWNVVIQSGHFSYQGKGSYGALPLPALPGAHQVVNAGTAIAALEQSPFAPLLTNDVLHKAMQTVRWPGRMQRMPDDIMPDRGTVELWLDGAHNDSGAEVLSAVLSQWAGDKPVYLVTAYKDKKDIDGFYRPLAGCFAKTFVTELPKSVPSTSASILTARLRGLGYNDVNEAADVSAAIESCVRAAPSSGARVIVTGSLFLVGEVLRRHGGG